MSNLIPITSHKIKTCNNASQQLMPTGLLADQKLSQVSGAAFGRIDGAHFVRRRIRSAVLRSHQLRPAGTGSWCVLLNRQPPESTQADYHPCKQAITRCNNLSITNMASAYDTNAEYRDYMRYGGRGDLPGVISGFSLPVRALVLCMWFKVGRNVHDPVIHFNRSVAAIFADEWKT